MHQAQIAIAQARMGYQKPLMYMSVRLNMQCEEARGEIVEIQEYEAHADSTVLKRKQVVIARII